MNTQMKKNRKKVSMEMEFEAQVLGEWMMRRDIYEAIIDAIENGLDDEWIESIVAECSSHTRRLRERHEQELAEFGEDYGTALTCADAAHAKVYGTQYRTLRHMLRDAFEGKPRPI